MVSRKTAKRILKQYGRHIKACEQRLGSSIELGRAYNCENYKELVRVANDK